MLPALFTLGNLLAGFAAIHFASQPFGAETIRGWSTLTFAGLLVFLGMFFDAVDGSVARLMRSASEFGGQLDSLADIVTFGVAPAFLTLQLVRVHLSETPGVWVIGPEADNVLGKIVWGAAAMYVSCAALRLARFNVESGLAGVNRRDVFRGLPSPGAAGVVASLVVLHQHLLITRFGGEIHPAFVRVAALGVPLAMLLCGFAMVSSIPYVHVTKRYTSGSQSFGFIARVVIVLALAIWWLQETLAIAFVAYAISGPARVAWLRRRRKSRKLRVER